MSAENLQPQLPRRQRRGLSIAGWALAGLVPLGLGAEGTAIFVEANNDLAYGAPAILSAQAEKTAGTRVQIVSEQDLARAQDVVSREPDPTKTIDAQETIVAYGIYQNEVLKEEIGNGAWASANEARARKGIGASLIGLAGSVAIAEAAVWQARRMRRFARRWTRGN